MKAFATRHLLHGSLLLALLGAVGCHKSDDVATGVDVPRANANGAPTTVTPLLNGYGEERIGYKSGQTSIETLAAPAPAPGVAPVANAAPAVAAAGPQYAYEPTAGPAYAPGSAPAYAAPTAAAGAPSVVATQTGGAPSVMPEPLPMLDAGVFEMDAGAPAPVVKAALPGREGLPLLPENPFRDATTMPASTFALDVDTGSYTLARGSINAGFLPDPESVRIEEFINYFHMHYAQPAAEQPFSTYTELSACPWNPEHDLLMVGVQGQEVPLANQPPANLVYLIDTSGSMGDPGKLSLLQQGFRMLTRQLRPMDHVSIVTYSTQANVLLENAAGNEQDRILAAINSLRADGSTAGAPGIQLAYETAQNHFIDGGNNRVLLATDGDFNVGISVVPDLVSFISGKRDAGVFLSVYGFGAAWNGGNYQDQVGEQLADNGDGIYFYIDGPEEARRAFIHTVTGSLLTVAKDVKLQVQFNPAQVAGYRLIGYENRVLSNADFANDSADGGELGAGLSMTAFFELVPPGEVLASAAPGTDPLQDVTDDANADPIPVTGDNLVDVRLRFKRQGVETSELATASYTAAQIHRSEPSLKFHFASAVAELAMALRGSQYLPATRLPQLEQQVHLALPADTEGAVAECASVVHETLLLAQ